MPLYSPRRYDIMRHCVGGMKAPYLVVLQHHDVPSATCIIAPLTLSQRGDHDSIAPPVDVNGTEYRARLLDLAAYPRPVLVETVALTERAADAIVHALDITFDPVGRPQ